MVVPGEFRLLRSRALLKFKKFPPYSEIECLDRSQWLAPGETPGLTLFVSHRWEADYEPDPSCQQLRALQYLIRQIANVVSAITLDPSSRCKIVPTPYVHGVLQAIAIVGGAYGSATDQNKKEWQHSWVRSWSECNGEEEGSELLDRVAIWYDYSCMPQSPVSESKHNVEHAAEVRDALFRLPELVAACPVVVLRSPGDGYDGRGWCAAELSIGREYHKHIVLRTDLVSQSIDKNDLIAAEEPFGRWTGTKNFLRLLDNWASPDTEVRGSFLYRIHYDYGELAQLEATRETPLFTTRQRPEVFPGHRALLMQLIQRLGAASESDRKTGTQTHCDMANTVSESMRNTGLSCSVADDVVFVGFTILEARHSGAPEMAALFRDCRRRWIENRSLRLARYREVRHGRRIQVWYLFEDEDPDHRPRPKWVKERKWIAGVLKRFRAD